MEVRLAREEDYPKSFLSRLDALLEVIYGGGLPEMIAFMEQKV